MEFFLGVLIFIADVWAIINVLQSRAAIFVKILWTVAILLLPVIGLLLWLLLGPKKAAGVAR